MKLTDAIIEFNKRAIVLLIFGGLVGVLIGYISNDMKLGIILGLCMGIGIIVAVNLFLFQKYRKKTREEFNDED